MSSYIPASATLIFGLRRVLYYTDPKNPSYEWSNYYLTRAGRDRALARSKKSRVIPGNGIARVDHFIFEFIKGPETNV